MNLNGCILITIFCWSIWGIFDKKALNSSTDKDVIIMLYSLYLLELPLVGGLLCYLSPGWHLNPQILCWSGLATLSITIATIAYLNALSKTEASWVLGITANYPVILQILAVILLGESLFIHRVIGGALIGLGMIAIGSSGSGNFSTLAAKDRIQLVLSVVIATLSWGAFGIFDKKAVAFAQPLVICFAQCIWGSIILIPLFLYFRRQGHSFQLQNKKTWLYCSLSAFSLFIGAWCYLSALFLSTASYVITITGCYPILMYIFALLFLKEKFNRIRLAGIALTILGGILVQMTQNLS